MQVINDTNAGGRLGAALGTGLNQLAQHKLSQLSSQYDSQMQRSQFAQKLAPILGEDTANFLSTLTPQERDYALENLGNLKHLNQPNNQQQDGNSGMQQLMQPQLSQQQNPQQQMQQALQQYFSNPTLGNNQQNGNGGIEQSMQQQNTNQGQQQQVNANQLSPEKIKLAQDLFISPERRKERDKLRLEKEKITSKENLAAWKNTQAYREKILNEEQSSREALGYIKEAQRLEKEGDFPSQAFASFLKGAEWEDVPGFLSGNAEAFNKILANFQRGVKDIYGGNVSNLEMEQFLKTIPTIYHTPEGRSLIFSGMKKYYRGGKERAKIEREIIKNNGGVPPQDLHERVNEKFIPIQKDLSRQFKRDIEGAEKLASKISRAGSVLSYGAGKVAGAVPGLAKSAARAGAAGLGGAALGSLVPGVGTTLGAGIGAGGSALKDLLNLLR